MFATLSFAFAAGALSTVNPCGFALLPGFLAYYIGQETGSASPSLLSRVYRGIRVGAALSAGYAVVFTIAGLLLAAGLRLLIGFVPWVVVVVGVGLVLLGVVLMTGRTVGLQFGTGAVGGRRSGVAGVVAYGAAYAVASLSCTLAVLLAVVAQALAAADAVAVISVFAAYAAGAASVLILLAVSAALASGALARAVRRTLPFVGRISGAVLVLSGAYLIAYWVPQLTGSRGDTALSRGGGMVAGTLTQWLEGRTSLVAAAAAILLLAAAVTAGWRAARRRTSEPREADAADSEDGCAPLAPDRQSDTGKDVNRQADR